MMSNELKRKNPVLTNSCELFPPAELFARVIPYIQPLLVAKDNLEPIREFVNLLPQDLHLAGFGFESSLNTSKCITDLSLCLHLPSVDKDKLKQWFKIDSLPISFQKIPAWQHLSSWIILECGDLAPLS